MKLIKILLFLFTLFFSGKKIPAKKGPAWFWVDGAGVWDGSDNSHWADASGGIGGTMPVPTIVDRVVFDENSGGGLGNVTISTGATCSSLEAAGFAGAFDGSGNLEIMENFILDGSTMTGCTWTGNLNCGSGSLVTIDAPGFTIGGVYVYNGGSATMQSDLTLSGSLVLEEGDFNGSTSNNTLSAYSLISNFGGNTRGLYIEDTYITLSGVGDIWDINSSGLTMLANGGTEITIADVSASTKTFKGGGLTYGSITLTGGSGSGSLNFTGSNSFASITNTNAPATFKFTAGSTTIITGAFNVTGTAGNLVTISSITSATHTLVNSTGSNISSDYLSISYSIVSPACPAANAWLAGTHSTNGGNNTGWTFAASCTPSNKSKFFFTPKP